MKIISAALVALLLPLSMHAQRENPIGMRMARDTTSHTGSTVIAASGRTVSAFVGGAFGAIFGSYVVYISMRQHCSGDPNFCSMQDFPNNGIAFGLVPGATLGAGLPRFGSPCPLSKRLTRALVGSLAGGALGAIAGRPQSNVTALWLAYGGSAVGSTVAVQRCR